MTRLDLVDGGTGEGYGGQTPYVKGLRRGDRPANRDATPGREENLPSAKTNQAPHGSTLLVRPQETPGKARFDQGVFRCLMIPQAGDKSDSRALDASADPPAYFHAIEQHQLAHFPPSPLVLRAYM